MITIAITGRSGVGKSTVTALVRAAGIAVADADAIAREVLAVGSPCLPALQAAFGADICNEGVLNRRLLADRAFATPQGTAALTGITHPEILARIAAMQQVANAAGQAIFAIDGAVIIGTPCEALCNQFVVVCAPLAQSIARITARDGIAPEMAARRLSAQLPEETLRARADFIIENNGDLAALTRQTNQIINTIRRAADATKAPQCV